MWWLKWRMNANLCEQRRLWRVCTFAQTNLAFVTVQNLLCCLKWRFVCYSRQQLILWWVCIFAQAKSLDNAISIRISCAGKRRLLGVCTFAQARMSLHHSIEISCAGWNSDFRNVYVNSECCGESALATKALLGNHQCVVSMRQKMLTVRCNKIPQ